MYFECGTQVNDDDYYYCTANLVHAVELPKSLCHKLYGSMCYANVLHVRGSQLKPSCSCWNLQSLVNPKHLSKLPDEIKVLPAKSYFRATKFLKSY